MLKLTLIAQWKQAWKMASVWMFTLILILPDMYEYAHSMNWTEELPESFKWIVRVVALVGIIVRLVKQKNIIVKGEITDAA